MTETRGAPIPGSHYYRNYCCRCGEPLRVTEDRRDALNLYCQDCDPPHIGVGRPHGSAIGSDYRNERGGYVSGHVETT